MTAPDDIVAVGHDLFISEVGKILKVTIELADERIQAVNWLTFQNNNILKLSATKQGNILVSFSGFFKHHRIHN